MKKGYRFLFGLILSFFLVVHADEVSPDRVEFDGNILFLADHDPSPAGTIREYLPKGDTFDKWTRLAGLYTFPDSDDPVAMAARLKQTVLQSNSMAHVSDVLVDDKTGEVVIDFLTTPAPNDWSFVEFNMEIQKIPSGRFNCFPIWVEGLRG